MPRVRQDTRTSSCYGRLTSRALLSGSDDDDDEVGYHPPERSYDASSRARSYPARTSNSRSRLRSISNSLSFEDIGIASESTVTETYISRYRKLTGFLRRVLVVLLTNVMISAIIIVLGIAISVSLGCHSLLVLKPFPIIDKSIKAFSIPNHISSQRQDALSVAKSDQKKYLSSIGYRRRRDLNLQPAYFSDHYDLAKQRESHQNSVKTAGMPNVQSQRGSAFTINNTASNKANNSIVDTSGNDYSYTREIKHFIQPALYNTADNRVVGDSPDMKDSTVNSRLKNVPYESGDHYKVPMQQTIKHAKNIMKETSGTAEHLLSGDRFGDMYLNDESSNDVPSITEVSKDDLKLHLYDVLDRQSHDTDNWSPWQPRSSTSSKVGNESQTAQAINTRDHESYIHREQNRPSNEQIPVNMNDTDYHDNNHDNAPFDLTSSDRKRSHESSGRKLYFSRDNYHVFNEGQRLLRNANLMNQKSSKKSSEDMLKHGQHMNRRGSSQAYLAEFLHDSEKHVKNTHSNHSRENMQSHTVRKRAGSDHHHRERRQLGVDARIYGRTQALRRWKMQIVYLAQGDGDLNVFTEKNLKHIHEIEKKVRQLKDYENFCLKDYYKWDSDSNLNVYGGCAPLNSLMTYFFPSQTPDGMIHYDGLGETLADVNKTLSFAMAHETFFWFVDDKINQSYRKSRLLRTEVHFGVPLPGYRYYSDRQEEQHRKFVDFVLTYIDLLSRQSTPYLRVLYGGNEIFDYQVDSTFWSDLHLSFVTFGLILLFMFILTSFSLWLTFWGILSIILSFPLAFFFYRQVFGVIHLGILNGAAAFVVIGIGVDDVFVFINTFRQAHHIRDPGERMLYTLAVAGKATFFTSFTTAAAFAANVASSIPAIHDFGLFMSLIVGCCWVMVVIVMPPAINIWLRYFAVCERACYSRCSCSCTKVKPLDLPSDIMNYLQGDGTSAATTSLVDSVPSDDSGIAMETASAGSNDDVPLLRMDDISNHEGGWPIYLGMLNQMMYEDDEPLLTLDGGHDEAIEIEDGFIVQASSREGCTLTNQIQAFLYYCIAKPVVRTRWFILGIYTVVLIIAISLMVQLKPATHPPQLFDSSTNLQMLMDLAANFSDSAITCDECSAFYKSTRRFMSPTDSEFEFAHTSASSRCEYSRTPLQRPPPVTSESGRCREVAATESEEGSVKLSSGLQKGGSGGGSGRYTNTDDGVLPPGLIIPSILTIPTIRTSTKTTTTTPTTATTIPGRTTTGTTTHSSQIGSTSATISTPLTPTESKAGQLSSNTAAPPIITRAAPPGGETSPSSESHGYTSSTIHQNDRMKDMPVGKNTTSASHMSGTYDPCARGKCDTVSIRPNLELGAVIFVVFGIKGIDRSNISYQHVLTDKGSAIYDLEFERHFSLQPGHLDLSILRDLCRICKMIANNTELVKTNSSQCIPRYGIPVHLISLIRLVHECSDLPEYVNHQLPGRAAAGLTPIGIQWLAFSFESTTYKGQSYFTAYREYQKWEAFISHLKTTVLPKDSPLQTIYQTSEFWENVMMEVVAVSSAIYGLVLSMIICVTTVTIFTGHITLLLIVVATMFGTICMVVAIFFMAGWEMGAIEAVSLSILVGSSVDYSVHLVEGYLIAGKNPPPSVIEDAGLLRRWRTTVAVSHIGVSITSSALTTIVAAIPLTLTIIQPFSKFGQIVTINTSMSILYTLTAGVAFLALAAPPRYINTWRSTVLATICTTSFIAILILILFIISRFGVDIPAPNGENLFSK